MFIERYLHHHQSQMHNHTTAIDELLPLVGSPAFIPTILSYLRNSSSGILPLDPVIFQNILVSIIAGDKHLILHTPEEDVALVVKLVVWVSVYE